MVATFRPRFPPLLDDVVLVSRRRVGQVRQRRELRVESALGLVELSLQRLDLRPNLSHLRDRVGRVLSRTLRLPDRLARLVAPRAQGLELRQDLASTLVEVQQLVHCIGRTASGKCRAHLVGLAAEELQVQHCVTGFRS